MSMDIGINGASIKYEVALDVLGGSRQPLMQMIRIEEAKAEPSKLFIEYCQARLLAIDELQDSLRLSDVGMIEHILNKETRSLWL